MTIPRLEIAAKSKKGGRRGRRQAKGRCFAARLLGFLTADCLWELGPHDKLLRPVWIAWFASQQENRAFFANFRAGKKAKTRSNALHIPKTASFRWSTHAAAGGEVTLGYLAELLELEPIQPADASASFVVAAPAWWVARQAEELRADFGSEAEEVARAALFVAYLDRRTPIPLLSDLRFHLQLHRAALDAGWLHEPEGTAWRRGVLYGEELENSGLDSPVACQVSQSVLTEFLIEQTAHFHQEVLSHGTPTVSPGSWILPNPGAAAPQLCFDFAMA